MKILLIALLLALPTLCLAREPYAMIIHSSKDSAAWSSAVVTERDLKIYFQKLDSEVVIPLASEERKRLVEECLIAIKAVVRESELAPILKTKAELLRISVTTGDRHLDVECPKTAKAALKIVSSIQRYLDAEKKKNQPLEPTAPSGRGSP